MKLQTHRVVPTLVAFCAVGLAGQAFAATIQTKTLPQEIRTEQGKVYQSVRFVSSAPDGLVIEYKPSTGGIGLAKLKFRNLPEDLRREFNYDESAAADFETARAKAVAEWRDNLVRSERQRFSEPEQGMEYSSNPAEQFPVGRFKAIGTIRGVMILDSITGEAWMMDLHSVLTDYQQPQLLQPKVLLPTQATVIGP